MSKLQVNEIVDKEGTGSPTFTNGVVVSGVGTFSSQVSIAGTLTYEDVTNVDAVGIVTARTGVKVLAGGINAVGVITGTSFKGDGSALTGIAATDNIDTNTIRVSGISTLANTKIGIGKSINFGSVQKTSIQGHSIGIGTTTTAGVAAGLGTAVGEIVYVMDDLLYGEQLRVYNGYQWVGITTEKVTVDMQATGGNVTITENGYRRHIFTSPGNLVVSSLASPASVLVVAGGGAGGGSIGNGQAGAGGAGGFRLASSIPFSNGATYPVTVGSGGAGVAPPGPGQGNDGNNSVFGYPTAITATGGGGGGGYDPGSGGYKAGRNGGSGGGHGNDGTGVGEGNSGGNDPRCSPISEGNDGGTSTTNSCGTGGGGAGQAGQGDGDDVGPGGAGAPVPADIAPTSYGEPGPSPGRYFAGGGGGGGSPSQAQGGVGGGGNGGQHAVGGDGTTNMGGGGGGAQGPGSSAYAGGSGGPGIVIVSYTYGS